MIALIGFSFVSAGTPGPNNILLWASGASFGVLASLRHVVGTALGLGAMALAVAAGLGALVTAVPGLEIVMKVAGSAYLLYLAAQIARSGGLERGTIAKPLGLLQAAAFQVINPKAWIFALAAMTTFRPPDLPVALGSVAVAVTMMVVILPSAGLWVVAGDALNRLAAGGRAGQVVRLVLAALVAAASCPCGSSGGAAGPSSGWALDSTDP